MRKIVLMAAMAASALMAAAPAAAQSYYAREHLGVGTPTSSTGPSVPGPNATDAEMVAYISSLVGQMRSAYSRGGNGGAVADQYRALLMGKPNITGVQFENAGWYSRYGFSNPEPYIYIGIAGDPWWSFCTAWAAAKPAGTANCDNYYGNHITIYMNP